MRSTRRRRSSSASPVARASRARSPLPSGVAGVIANPSCGDSLRRAHEVGAAAGRRIEHHRPGLVVDRGRLHQRAQPTCASVTRRRSCQIISLQPLPSTARSSMCGATASARKSGRSKRHPPSPDLDLPIQRAHQIPRTSSTARSPKPSSSVCEQRPASSITRESLRATTPAARLRGGAAAPRAPPQVAAPASRGGRHRGRPVARPGNRARRQRHGRERNGGGAQPDCIAGWFHVGSSGPASMPVGRRLEAMRDPEQPRLVEIGRSAASRPAGLGRRPPASTAPASRRATRAACRHRRGSSSPDRRRARRGATRHSARRPAITSTVANAGPKSSAISRRNCCACR